jgi:hypothetical protein
LLGLGLTLAATLRVSGLTVAGASI